MKEFHKPFFVIRCLFSYPELCQGLIQLPCHFIDVLFLNDERRNEAQDVAAGGDHDKAVFEGRAADLSDRNRRINDDALHKAHAAVSLQDRVSLNEAIERLFKVGGGFFDMVDNAVFFKNRKCFYHCGADKRIAAVGRTMVAGLKRGGGRFFVQQKRTDRNTVAKRLGDGQDVGLYAEGLMRERVAGTAESALDLVKDQKNIMFIVILLVILIVVKLGHGFIIINQIFAQKLAAVHFMES